MTQVPGLTVGLRTDGLVDIRIRAPDGQEGLITLPLSCAEFLRDELTFLCARLRARAEAAQVDAPEPTPPLEKENLQ